MASITNVGGDTVFSTIRNVDKPVRDHRQLRTPTVQALGRRSRPRAISETNASFVANQSEVPVANILSSGVERCPRVVQENDTTSVDVRQDATIDKLARWRRI